MNIAADFNVAAICAGCAWPGCEGVATRDDARSLRSAALPQLVLLGQARSRPGALVMMQSIRWSAEIQHVAPKRLRQLSAVAHTSCSHRVLHASRCAVSPLFLRAAHACQGAHSIKATSTHTLRIRLQEVRCAVALRSPLMMLHTQAQELVKSLPTSLASLQLDCMAFVEVLASSQPSEPRALRCHYARPNVSSNW